MSRRRQPPEDLTQLVRDSPTDDPEVGVVNAGVVPSPSAQGSASAPTIQISHPNVPDSQPKVGAAQAQDSAPDVEGGITNPVFFLEEDDVTDKKENATGAAPPQPDPAGASAVCSNQEPDAAATSSPGDSATGTPHGTVPGKGKVTLPPVETTETPADKKGVAIPPIRTSVSSPVLDNRRSSQNVLVKSNSLAVPDAMVLRRRHSLSTPEHSSGGSSPAGSASDLSAAPQHLSPGYDRARSSSVTWSEIDQLEKRRGSTETVTSDEEMSRRMSSLSTSMSERLIKLSRRFHERTERYKEQTVRPPTPSTGDSEESKSDLSAVSATSDVKVEEAMKKRKTEEEARRAAEEKEKEDAKAFPVRYWENKCCKIRVPSCWERLVYLCGAIDPQSQIYLCWLAFMSGCYVYNCMSCTLRAGFRAGPFYVFPYELEAHRKKYLDLAQQNTTTDCVVTEYTQNGSAVLSPCIFNETAAEELIPPFPVRWKLGYETPENRIYWWMVDYFCDLMYIVDILFVRSRLGFINNGMFETRILECWKNYKSKVQFKLDLLSVFPTDLSYMFKNVDYNSGVRINRVLRYDIISLTPLDLLYFIPQLDYFSLVRLPRILRIHIFWEFFDRVDQVAKSGYIIRIIRTLTYMLFLIHLESCGYYAMSAYEGFGLNDWVYSGEGNAYIRCAYLATKTATSIGNNPKPRNTLEYGFMTVYWLSGVFVFAMLIGQIRDIFVSVTSAETYYRRSMDRAVSYMQGLNVPRELQNKVRSWFNYNWEYQKTLNENSLLDGLPIKMVAELQIAVHYQTLSKVQLFQDCEKNLLYDLVVKLRPSLYLPQDYICQKGEVGTEMYILKQGHVEVVGGENDSIVFATLHEGSVFGEISLLGIQGGNRRTASVRSKGYSNLFVLTKQDFENAMADYPEAHKLLKKRSMKVLAKNKKKVEEVKKIEVEEIIKQSEHETPKMVKTVISLLNPESHLRRASMRRASFLSESGTLTPPGSYQDDPDADDEEILRIEREERPLMTSSETRLSIDEPAPDAAVVITMEDLQKEQSHTLPVNEPPPIVPASPPQTTKTDTIIKPQLNGHISNKVHPAEITVEKETEDNKPKKKPRSAKLTRSNRIEPMDTGPTDEDEVARRNALNVQQPKGEGEIPAGNIVTCDVEVHREKTPSLVSITGAGGQNGGVPSKVETPPPQRTDTPKGNSE